MVALALAVVPVAVLACAVFLVVFRRAFPPAFASPDELARWATSLRVTEVRLTWLGGVSHVEIDLTPLPELTAANSDRGQDDHVQHKSEVDEALNRMAIGHRRRVA